VMSRTRSHRMSAQRREDKTRGLAPARLRQVSFRSPHLSSQPPQQTWRARSAGCTNLSTPELQLVDSETISYSSEALRQDPERLRGIWDDCQASRDRNASYGYLTAVYDLVAVWAAEGREADRAHRALRLQRLKVSYREDPFAAVIRCTAEPAKADKRARSKWSRAMRYAVAYKADSEALDRFVRRKGGINACAARFGWCFGKNRVTTSERRSAGG
jgi:hypothetical protein